MTMITIMTVSIITIASILIFVFAAINLAGTLDEQELADEQKGDYRHGT